MQGFADLVGSDLPIAATIAFGALIAFLAVVSTCYLVKAEKSLGKHMRWRIGLLLELLFLGTAAFCWLNRPSLAFTFALPSMLSITMKMLFHEDTQHPTPNA